MGLRNEYILECLKNGYYEELKAAVENDMYKNSLNTTGKKRYSAMKKYFTFLDNKYNEALQKPCKVEYNGAEYTSFINGHTMVLTTETAEGMEHTNRVTYFDYIKLLDTSNYHSIGKIDFNGLFLQAKKHGYKLTKKEYNSNFDFTCIFKICGGFFKPSTIDSAFSILNNGEPAEVLYYNEKSPLYIKNSIGMALIMPMHVDINKNTKPIIEAAAI